MYEIGLDRVKFSWPGDPVCFYPHWASFCLTVKPYAVSDTTTTTEIQFKYSSKIFFKKVLKGIERLNPFQTWPDKSESGWWGGVWPPLRTRTMMTNIQNFWGWDIWYHPSQGWNSTLVEVKFHPDFIEFRRPSLAPIPRGVDSNIYGGEVMFKSTSLKCCYNLSIDFAPPRSWCPGQTV